MMDQKKNLDEFWDRTEYLQGGQAGEEKQDIIKRFNAGRLQLIWIAPERLQSRAFRDALRAAAQRYTMGFAVIDEVHCLSEWGHDFRTSYLTLIDTIMHLSKIEETETTITWKTVSMDSLVHYAAELIEPQAKAKNVTITVDTEPLYAYGNAALLSELIMNLLDNAVKYNTQGGSVHAVLCPEGEDKIKLTVSDTGIGIAKEKQDRVFERFYRAEESRNKATGGTGLGLAICKHIVDKHKGTLSVFSEEGKGTTMTVILPRVSEADVSKEEIETLTARQEAEDAESGKLAEREAEEDRRTEEETGETRAEILKPEKPLHKEKKNKKKKKKALDRDKSRIKEDKKKK